VHAFASLHVLCAGPSQASLIIASEAKQSRAKRTAAGRCWIAFTAARLLAMTPGRGSALVRQPELVQHRKKSRAFREDPRKFG
jgi:hypothetical protein